MSFGLSHRTAPIHIRERVAFPSDQLDEANHVLRNHCDLSESLVLSTCNRVEVLARAADGTSSTRINEFLHRQHSLASGSLNEFLYSIRDSQVVRHLFRVAGSLDSMVVGEAQILGQLKQAYCSARDGGHIGKCLERLVPRAFFVAKRIRTETQIGSSAVSVSSVAVELAQKIFGSLEGRSILVLGAGKMAELAASNLQRSGVKGVMVANRSAEASSLLASRLNGRSVPLSKLEHYLIETDVVIVSTSSPDYLIDRKMMERAIRVRKQRPLFIIDISVPRNVDPEVHSIENVFLFDVDDLRSVVDSNIEERRRSARDAETIVEEEVKKFVTQQTSARIGPLAKALRQRFEELCLRDFDALARGMDEREQAKVRANLRKTAHRMAHPLILELKNASDPEKKAREMDLLSRVYRLDRKE